MANGVAAHGASVDNIFLVWYTDDMKIIFLLIWSALVVARADSVTFEWAHNPEPDLAGYRLYIGASPYIPEATFVIPAGQNRVTVNMQPGQIAWLGAFNAYAESNPTPTILYRPIIGTMVLEFSEDLLNYSELVRSEAFRIPDINFNSVPTPRLNITKDWVQVHVGGWSYFLAVEMSEGKKFFRARIDF